MNGWVEVRGAEVREGDLIKVGGRLVRVERIEPYLTHPDPTISDGRMAYYQSPHSPQHEDAITVFRDDRVMVSR